MQPRSGFTLIEVAVSIVVLAGAVAIGGMALNSIERSRGYRNAVFEATMLADNEAELITAVNRCGRLCNDTSYTIICNRLPFTVERSISTASDFSLRESSANDRETAIIITFNSSPEHRWIFSMHQEVIIDK